MPISTDPDHKVYPDFDPIFVIGRFGTVFVIGRFGTVFVMGRFGTLAIAGPRVPNCPTGASILTAGADTFPKEDTATVKLTIVVAAVVLVVREGTTNCEDWIKNVFGKP